MVCLEGILLGRFCHINSFEFIDRKLPEFESGDIIKFKLVFNCSKKYPEVVARIAIRSMDGENVAMSESTLISEVIGNSEVIFKFDSKNLPDGMYTMTVSLNEISEYGEYEMLDEIPESIAFKITENDLFGKHKSAWIGKYWGRIRLDPMEIDIVCKGRC